MLGARTPSSANACAARARRKKSDYDSRCALNADGDVLSNPKGCKESIRWSESAETTGRRN
jgi:hypothetical protein